MSKFLKYYYLLLKKKKRFFKISHIQNFFLNSSSRRHGISPNNFNERYFKNNFFSFYSLKRLKKKYSFFFKKLKKLKFFKNFLFYFIREIPKQILTKFKSWKIYSNFIFQSVQKKKFKKNSFLFITKIFKKILKKNLLGLLKRNSNVRKMLKKKYKKKKSKRKFSNKHIKNYKKSSYPAGNQYNSSKSNFFFNRYSKKKNKIAYLPTKLIKETETHFLSAMDGHKKKEKKFLKGYFKKHKIAGRGNNSSFKRFFNSGWSNKNFYNSKKNSNFSFSGSTFNDSKNYLKKPYFFNKGGNHNKNFNKNTSRIRRSNNNKLSFFIRNKKKVIKFKFHNSIIKFNAYTNCIFNKIYKKNTFFSRRSNIKKKIIISKKKQFFYRYIGFLKRSLNYIKFASFLGSSHLFNLRSSRNFKNLVFLKKKLYKSFANKKSLYNADRKLVLNKNFFFMFKISKKKRSLKMNFVNLRRAVFKFNLKKNLATPFNFYLKKKFALPILASSNFLLRYLFKRRSKFLFFKKIRLFKKNSNLLRVGSSLGYRINKKKKRWDEKNEKNELIKKERYISSFKKRSRDGRNYELTHNRRNPFFKSTRISGTSNIKTNQNKIYTNFELPYNNNSHKKNLQNKKYYFKTKKYDFSLNDPNFFTGESTSLKKNNKRNNSIKITKKRIWRLFIDNSHLYLSKIVRKITDVENFNKIFREVRINFFDFIKKFYNKSLKNSLIELKRDSRLKKVFLKKKKIALNFFQSNFFFLNFMRSRIKIKKLKFQKISSFFQNEKTKKKKVRVVAPDFRDFRLSREERQKLMGVLIKKKFIFSSSLKLAPKKKSTSKRAPNFKKNTRSSKRYKLRPFSKNYLSSYFKLFKQFKKKKKYSSSKKTNVLLPSKKFFVLGKSEPYLLKFLFSKNWSKINYFNMGSNNNLDFLSNFFKSLSFSFRKKIFLIFFENLVAYRSTIRRYFFKKKFRNLIFFSNFFLKNKKKLGSLNFFFSLVKKKKIFFFLIFFFLNMLNFKKSKIKILQSRLLKKSFNRFFKYNYRSKYLIYTRKTKKKTKKMRPRVKFMKFNHFYIKKYKSSSPIELSSTTGVSRQQFSKKLNFSLNQIVLNNSTKFLKYVNFRLFFLKSSAASSRYSSFSQFFFIKKRNVVSKYNFFAFKNYFFKKKNFFNKSLKHSKIYNKRFFNFLKVESSKSLLLVRAKLKKWRSYKRSNLTKLKIRNYFFNSPENIINKKASSFVIKKKKKFLNYQKKKIKFRKSKRVKFHLKLNYSNKFFKTSNFGELSYNFFYKKGKLDLYSNIRKSFIFFKKFKLVNYRSFARSVFFNFSSYLKKNKINFFFLKNLFCFTGTSGNLFKNQKKQSSKLFFLLKKFAFYKNFYKKRSLLHSRSFLTKYKNFILLFKFFLKKKKDIFKNFLKVDSSNITKVGNFNLRYFIKKLLFKRIKKTKIIKKKYNFYYYLNSTNFFYSSRSVSFFNSRTNNFFFEPLLFKKIFHKSTLFLTFFFKNKKFFLLSKFITFVSSYKLSLILKKQIYINFFNVFLLALKRYSLKNYKNISNWMVKHIFFNGGSSTIRVLVFLFYSCNVVGYYYSFLTFLSFILEKWRSRKHFKIMSVVKTLIWNFPFVRPFYSFYLLISGKFNRKPRARSVHIIRNFLPQFQNVSITISYYHTLARNLFGAFGLHIWIYHRF